MTQQTEYPKKFKPAVTETTPPIFSREGLQSLAHHPRVKFVLVIVGLIVLLTVLWNWVESLIEKAVLDAAGSKEVAAQLMENP